MRMMVGYRAVREMVTLQPVKFAAMELLAELSRRNVPRGAATPISADTPAPAPVFPGAQSTCRV